MRRRDFLKGLAAVCGVVALPVVAAAEKGPYDEQLARYLKAAPPMDVVTLNDHVHDIPGWIRPPIHGTDTCLTPPSCV